MKIDNTAIITSLTAAYKRLQAADKFVVGFNIDSTVFYAEIPIDILLNDFCGVSMTSDETPCKRLRVKPLNKKLQTLFLTFSPQKLCSFAELQETAKADFSGNCGQAFEFLVCKAYNGKQTKVNTQWWKDGDFTANNLKFQAKFQLATVITEYTMQEAIAES